jgi:hypothetical protein
MPTTPRQSSLWDRLLPDFTGIGSNDAFWTWIDANTADLGVVVHPNHPNWDTSPSPEDRFNWHVGYTGLAAVVVVGIEELGIGDPTLIRTRTQQAFSLSDHEVLQVEDIITWVISNDVTGPKKQDRAWNLAVFPLTMDRVERDEWDQTRFYNFFGIRADI